MNKIAKIAGIGTVLASSAFVSAAHVNNTKQSAQAEPKEIAMPIDYGAAKNEVFVLTVTVTDSSGIHYIVNNQQRIKADETETVILKGHGTGTVRVIFDNEIVSEKTANFTTGELS